MASKEEQAPENAQDLTIFVQNLLEQMVRSPFMQHSIPLNISSFSLPH
tara:strand:+ start:125 stop:268 length:144 start_codon:yes stop_codon:yes gene_type:complete